MDAPPDLVTTRTRLRPVAADDVVTLRAILATPPVARWWHPPGGEWPSDEGGVQRWTVELGSAPELGPAGAVVGMVQSWEEDDPDYDECGIDLFLAGSVHRRGLGREVVTAVRDRLVRDRGHGRVTVDPAVGNAGAVACYRACGFVSVGVLHRRERDTDGPGWHDTLLMEYVAPR